MLQADDILLLQAGTAALERTVEEDRLELVERAGRGAQPRAGGAQLDGSGVLPNAVVQGSSPASLDLRRRYGVNLVAAARRAAASKAVCAMPRSGTGDVLLLEGEPARLRAAIADLGCLPLADRRLVFQPGALPCRSRLFAWGIALAASGLLPAAVAFTAVVVAMVISACDGPAQVYESIDWPVIVLLGAIFRWRCAAADRSRAADRRQHSGDRRRGRAAASCWPWS